MDGAGADVPGGEQADREPVGRWRALLDGEHAWSAEWEAWTAQLSMIRDSVMGLPPFPMTLWVGGLAVLLIVGAGRVSRSSRLVRAARPAPPSVERVVAEAAEQLGLRRPPTTLMVDQCISPMLWCGRRSPRLLLPTALWAQLDPVGRSAIVVHELAHLRRRDHWVCWVEALVGALYWWHPVVWWIRRRLREEADLACDVWVTAIHPTGRRAYAQALLDTRNYSAPSPGTVPSIGLGATTFRAKRFARRLTMVMTSQLKPRVSARGFALAGAVALMAYVASPLWACPPEEKRASKVRPDARLPSYKVLVAPKPPRPPEPPAARSRPAAPAPAEGVTTFERFMRDRKPDRDDMSLEDRIRELEREIEILYRQLQQVPRRSGAGVSGGRGFGFAVPTVTLPELAPFAAMIVGSRGGDGVPTVDGDNCLRGAATMGGETVVRSYKLNGGKLEALGALMLRSDIPIRVRMTNDQIEVHASPAQHCIFELFCKLIDGEDRVEAHVLPVDKLAALTELMVRSDVPILVEPGREQIKVHGTDVEQAVFDAFCRLIHPSNDAVAIRSATTDAYAAYETAAGLAQQYEAYATAQVATMRALRSRLRALEAQLRNLERQADRKSDRADELADKADSYADEADSLFDDAEKSGLARSRSVLARAEMLRNKADERLRQAESLESEAELLQDQAEQIEDVIEELEDQIEEIEDAVEDEDD